MSYERLNISIDEYNELKTKLRTKFIQIAGIFTRENYRQEDDFFAAFCAALSLTTISFGDGYYLRFETSKTAHKGKNSPEHRFGCDFGIKIEWVSTSGDNLQKGIIGQAKNNRLKNADSKDLSVQCAKMAIVTGNYIVILRDDSHHIPVVHIGDRENKYFHENSIIFDDYLIDHVMACLHGEINTGDINTMLKSGLDEFNRFIIEIETNLPKPKITLKPKRQNKPKNRP
ncbi:hypothetical protein [Yersinia aleksiciae]|uniref:Restriction endonuclease n=1 Tax=Yersinia aleksiciae TaxID=263819 RepID=A0ABM5UAK6_YERAE|nr:hypothetical protein [Yersinia aleksiciae]AKP32797.1 hypothetical protein ACZ76_04135 [Yersinia aleksiciae]CFQ51025.1 Uncharacterised protein [Yersinia aleksiciae]